jgi:hypothetical protein
MNEQRNKGSDIMRCTVQTINSSNAGGLSLRGCACIKEYCIFKILHHGQELRFKLRCHGMVNLFWLPINGSLPAKGLGTV